MPALSTGSGQAPARSVYILPADVRLREHDESLLRHPRAGEDPVSFVKSARKQNFQAYFASKKRLIHRRGFFPVRDTGAFPHLTE